MISISPFFVPEGHFIVALLIFLSSVTPRG